MQKVTNEGQILSTKSCQKLLLCTMTHDLAYRRPKCKKGLYWGQILSTNRTQNALERNLSQVKLGLVIESISRERTAFGWMTHSNDAVIWVGHSSNSNKRMSCILRHQICVQNVCDIILVKLPCAFDLALQKCILRAKHSPINRCLTWVSQMLRDRYISLRGGQLLWRTDSYCVQSYQNHTACPSQIWLIL